MNDNDSCHNTHNYHKCKLTTTTMMFVNDTDIIYDDIFIINGLM